MQRLTTPQTSDNEMHYFMFDADGSLYNDIYAGLLHWFFADHIDELVRIQNLSDREAQQEALAVLNKIYDEWIPAALIEMKNVVLGSKENRDLYNKNMLADIQTLTSVAMNYQSSYSDTTMPYEELIKVITDVMYEVDPDILTKLVIDSNEIVVSEIKSLPPESVVIVSGSKCQGNEMDQRANLFNARGLYVLDLHHVANRLGVAHNPINIVDLIPDIDGLRFATDETLRRALYNAKVPETPIDDERYQWQDTRKFSYVAVVANAARIDYPNSKIKLYFSDDRSDITNALTSILKNTELLPNGVTFICRRYENIIHSEVRIECTGEVDLMYIDHVGVLLCDAAHLDACLAKNGIEKCVTPTLENLHALPDQECDVIDLLAYEKYQQKYLNLIRTDNEKLKQMFPDNFSVDMVKQIYKGYEHPSQVPAEYTVASLTTPSQAFNGLDHAVTSGAAMAAVTISSAAAAPVPASTISTTSVAVSSVSLFPRVIKPAVTPVRKSDTSSLTK